MKAFAGVMLACLSTAMVFGGSVLVPRNSGWHLKDWKYHLGTAAPSGEADAWRNRNFDDRGWAAGKGPFGYGLSARYGTRLADMQKSYSTVYLRTSFVVSDGSSLQNLILDVNYTGGFVAWINGVRVAGRNVPADLSHRAMSTATRSTSPGDYESFALNNSALFLHNGENVLAIQAFTSDLSSGTFYIDAGLVNTRSLAHNRAAHASSVGSGRNKDAQFFRPFNAVDGTQMTFFTSDAGGPQWFYVDLGRDCAIDKARFHWWGDRQPLEFEVQVSRNGEAWTDVYVTVDAPKATKTEVVFPKVTARYVRLYATKARRPDVGVPISLCEVFEAGTPFEPSEVHSLAEGRNVVASSENSRCSFCGPAVMATNGHILSWWHSAASDPQWLAVDLGSVQPINRVRLLEGENNKRYTIQVSLDGTEWSDIPAARREALIRGGDVKRIVDLNFPRDVSARHVRFLGMERNDEAHGYTLFELLVFNDNIAGTRDRERGLR